jgi:tetratricopeptide (TPR) repeat protein
MRTYGLEKARADGWLEQLGQGSQGFAQLCDVVGKRFVAFSVIAGVRITALTVDPRNPNASIVDFELGEAGRSQRLPLGDFRERLADVLLTGDDPELPVPSAAKPSSEEIQTFIGFRYVLLAPLFDIRLEELRIDGPEISVAATIGGERIELGLDVFREEIKDRIRAEAEKHRSTGSPFAIDLNLVPQARKALAAGDPDRVAELLGAWPGPLSLLLRTAEGAALTPEVRATLAEALGILGTSYVQLGRHEWAQEVLRLAIQWGQEQLEVAADLFRRLGAAYVAEGRHGEAIGLLRRSLGLGAPRAEVLPVLARCFLMRDRYIAALLCADDALVAGAPADLVKDVRQKSLEKLGDPWVKFRRRVPASSGTR